MPIRPNAGVRALTRMSHIRLRAREFDWDYMLSITATYCLLPHLSEMPATALCTVQGPCNSHLFLELTVE